MIYLWAQELLVYNLTVIHRKYRMMDNFDALTFRFEPLIAKHLATVDILRYGYQLYLPKSYVAAAIIFIKTSNYIIYKT